MYLRARNFGISYLPQEPSIFRKLTVEENIMAVLEAQPLDSPERRTRTERLIHQLNLGHIRTTRGYALSGGERRRVEIARSLCIQPSFILLDEPFSGIDPIAVLELQKIIFDLKASGIGVLITDHNVRETLERNRPGLYHRRREDLSLRNSTRTGQRRGGAAASIWGRVSRWADESLRRQECKAFDGNLFAVNPSTFNAVTLHSRGIFPDWALPNPEQLSHCATF